MIIYGIHAVGEALKAGRVRALRVSRRGDDRMRAILDLARERNVRVERLTDDQLNQLAPNTVHQGVIADLESARDYDVADLVREAPHPALLVVLDGIEDPHNFGAILRTVDAAGAHGVIRQTRHAAKMGSAAAKASAGAIAHVKVAEVVNIARAIEELKELNVWTVGLAGDAPTRYDQLDLRVPTALVLGAEGTGLRRLVRERCDFLMNIPMFGHMESLNVSVAAGVALYEAVRQRGSGLQTPGSGQALSRKPEA